METLWQDLRFGTRVLTHAPGFSVVAVFALALGIGANTAMFSVVNSLLIRPLAYPDSGRLVKINNWESGANSQSAVSPPGFADYRDQTHSFESVSAIYLGNTALNFNEQGEPERLQGGRVSANFFTTLGVEPALGRAFLPEEEQPGRNRVVVLSYGLWRRAFGADRDLVGKDIRLNGQSFSVAGVMPRSFQWQSDDLWTPLALSPESFAHDQRGSEYLGVIARLKSDVTLQQAQAEMNIIADDIKEKNPDFYPRDEGWGVRVSLLQDEVVGGIRPALLILLGAVGFVLLIACANVANLLIARAASRQKEIAIRAALGAQRMQIIRQLLTESLLLALAGGGLGLLMAVWGLDLLVKLSGNNIPRAQEIAIDGRVLAFTLLVSILTAVLFGLLPAIQTSKADLQAVLKEGGRGSTGTRQRTHGLLVVTDVALSLVLLIGAALLLKSFSRLQNVSPGFQARGLLTMKVSLPAFRYREPNQVRAFYEQTLEQIGVLPGVESAAAVSDLPLSGSVHSGSFNIENRPAPPGEDGPHADLRSITPGYFQAMKIPLLEGRYFTDRDTREGLPVAIIDEALALRYFPGEDPLGKRLEFQPGKPIWREVVGVVGSIRHKGLDIDFHENLYYPHAQVSNSTMFVAVRTNSDPLSMVAAVRGAVKAVDKDQPVYKIMTMDQLLSDSLSQRRLSVMLMGVFAAAAMVLAAVGLYGVISYSVAQRTHEIGIRMALGASPSDIFKTTVGQGMLLTLAGLGLGLAGAFALTRVMAGLLFGVTATDPATFAAVTLLLAGVALGACFVPARRATKVDPMIALRYE
ncbi:MAG TPA: ABC transporter permease [Blastocatellia bacterium]|nr:ABC transporter permease [Blastocatellia bacterium]